MINSRNPENPWQLLQFLTKNQFKLGKAKRAVAVRADWSEGLGFGINEAVWTNIRPTV